MKVVVVHNLPHGGARRRLANQLSHMADHEILEVVPSTAEPITPDARVVPFHLVAARAPRWSRPLLRYLDVAALFVGYRRLTRLVESVEHDVVWLNPCRYLQAPHVKSSRPSVYYCDEPRRADYDPAARAQMNRQTRLLYAPMRRLERTMDRAVVTATTALATNSAFTARAITNAYEREADVVYCGVAESFLPSGTSAPEHVLTVGTMIPTKGHDLVIEAVAESRVQLPVIVVSPREESDERDRLEALAARLGVQVHFRFAVTDEELVGLYRTAFATVYLAHEEPFGLVSIEAQACGSPVIVADEGGLPETVEDGVTGWAVLRSAKAAADRLDELLEPETRRLMSEAARARSSRWSWATSGQQMVELLTGVRS